MGQPFADKRKQPDEVCPRGDLTMLGLLTRHMALGRVILYRAGYWILKQRDDCDND